MTESRQSSRTLERQVLVARDHWQVWARHELELFARVAVGHEHVEDELERALPVDGLAEQQDALDGLEAGLLVQQLLRDRRVLVARYEP